MLKTRDARILDGDTDGGVLHVEWTTDAGETVVGIYQLMGWTEAPRKVKTQFEAALWVPPKEK
jgi:hypothetical protein